MRPFYDAFLAYSLIAEIVRPVGYDVSAGVGDVRVVDYVPRLVGA